MKIVAVFLTTFNRSAVLLRTLPEIQRQARAAGLELLIIDDASSDPATLWAVKDAESRGARLLMTEPHDYHAHVSIGRTFVRGVRNLIERHGRDVAFLKVDDDALLAPDAFGALVDGWRELWDRELNPAALSALLQAERRDALEPVTKGIWRSYRACSVTCVHRLDLWADILGSLDATGQRALLEAGWDIYFWEWCKAAGRAQYTTCPSRAYHLGHLGVHGLDMSRFNREPPDKFAFPGPWKNGKPAAAVVEVPPGKHADYVRLYGSRAADPDPEHWIL